MRLTPGCDHVNTFLMLLLGPTDNRVWVSLITNRCSAFWTRMKDRPSVPSRSARKRVLVDQWVKGCTFRESAYHLITKWPGVIIRVIEVG
jgi:hypothetical protein